MRDMLAMIPTHKPRRRNNPSATAPTDDCAQANSSPSPTPHPLLPPPPAPFPADPPSLPLHASPVSCSPFAPRAGSAEAREGATAAAPVRWRAGCVRRVPAPASFIEGALCAGGLCDAAVAVVAAVGACVRRLPVLVSPLSRASGAKRSKLAHWKPGVMVMWVGIREERGGYRVIV
jgi:hypothetical protein